MQLSSQQMLLEQEIERYERSLRSPYMNRHSLEDWERSSIQTPSFSRKVQFQTCYFKKKLAKLQDS